METRGIERFCKENNIELLVLFGSSATDKTHSGSDMDIAVKGSRGVNLPKLKLIYMLDDFFKGKDIDLVLLTPDTDPLLVHEIFFRGRLLYEGKKGLFDKERLRAWKLYLDTEKLRKQNESYLKSFVKRVSDVA